MAKLRGKLAPKTMPAVSLSETLKISQKQYANLLKYLTDRLDLAKAVRDSRVDTLEYIDREYYGYMKRDADDRKRERDNRAGRGVKPTNEKLSFLFSQIDEATTYLLSVLAPDESLYSAQAPAEQQKVADGLSTVMNEHAEEFGHVRQLSLFLNACLRYNFGAFGVEWVQRKGNAVTGGLGGTKPQMMRNTIIAEGNALVAYDPYNLLFDPSCDPIELQTRGEYFGYVEVHTPFRLQMMAANDGLQNVEQFISEKPSSTFHYFKEHPVVRSDSAGDSTETNWVSVFSMGFGGGVDTAKGYEITKMYCYIVPNKFGLSKTDTFELWRFILGSNSHILFAEPAELPHGMLPLNVAIPFEDHFKLQAKTVAERLIPYQNFASFVLNVHQHAVRKKLYGLTVYDKRVLPLLDSVDVDLIGGKIPAQNLGAQDIDLRKHIVQFNDGPDTTNSLENIEFAQKLMQNILPTTILQQVAGLERATQYQAAALVQGSNRRNLKIAKIINSQAMNYSRHMQFLNILWLMQNIEVLAPDGKLVTIDMHELRSTKMKFMISDGLKGLDRLALLMNMKELFNSVLQSRQASTQVDVLKLMDYMSTMMGDYTDFTQFRIQSPIDTLPPDQKNIAFQLLQQFIAQQKGGGGAATPPA